MGRRSRKADYQSSSDSEYYERESIADGHSDTDLTEPEDEVDEACHAGDAALLVTHTTLVHDRLRRSPRRRGTRLAALFKENTR